MTLFAIMTRGGYALMNGYGDVLIFTSKADAEAYARSMGAIGDTMTAREVAIVS